MEYTAPPKPQLSSRANAFSIAALMASGSPKEKEPAESTIKPLGERAGPGAGGEQAAEPPILPGGPPSLRPAARTPLPKAPAAPGRCPSAPSPVAPL